MGDQGDNQSADQGSIEPPPLPSGIKVDPGIDVDSVRGSGEGEGERITFPAPRRS